MATSILVSSILSSLILRRKPPTATCRLQGLLMRRAKFEGQASSTCPLFSLSPTSGRNSSAEVTGILPGSSRIWGSVPKFRGGRLVAYRLMERHTSNRKSSQCVITNSSVKEEKFRGLGKQVTGRYACVVGARVKTHRIWYFVDYTHYNRRLQF